MEILSVLSPKRDRGSKGVKDWTPVFWGKLLDIGLIYLVVDSAVQKTVKWCRFAALLNNNWRSRVPT